MKITKLKKDKKLGNKALNLSLIQNLFNIPKSFVIYDFNGEFTKEDKEKIKKEIKEISDTKFAIRSSANVEDSKDFS